MQFQDLFLLGMKRELGYLVGMPESGVILNIGAGNTQIPGAINIDHPHTDSIGIKWDADSGNPLSFFENSVDGIHCYHFLEHCENPVRVLRQFQRVLKPGGILNIVVPYYRVQLSCEDLDHKHFFTEDTWKTLFKNQYYDKHRVVWKFDIQFNLIAGIVERNLCLFTQLIKTV